VGGPGDSTVVGPVLFPEHGLSVPADSPASAVSHGSAPTTMIPGAAGPTTARRTNDRSTPFRCVASTQRTRNPIVIGGLRPTNGGNSRTCGRWFDKLCSSTCLELGPLPMSYWGRALGHIGAVTCCAVQLVRPLVHWREYSRQRGRIDAARDPLARRRRASRVVMFSIHRCATRVACVAL
jgi:hypothetical protein